jgi:antibiotic biosynthesis monooxygenase (ABM) superfamily enzyme
MESNLVINMVATRCQPEVEAKFNKWYDEVHIPLLFGFPGMTRVTRYQALKKTDGESTYLAIYEFKDGKALAEYEQSPELAAARKEMQESWPGKDFEITWRMQYGAIKTWER